MEVVGSELEATGAASVVICFDCFFLVCVGGLGLEVDGLVLGSLDFKEVAVEDSALDLADEDASCLCLRFTASVEGLLSALEGGRRCSSSLLSLS